MRYRELLFRKGDYYPAPDHEERIYRYKTNKDIFKGDHWSAFGRYSDKLNKITRESLYLSCSLPNLISKKSADFLFGDALQIKAGSGDNTPEQEKMDEYVKNNNLNITFYESALTNSFKGDNFTKIRWAQEFDGRLPASLDPFRIIIENIPAEFVYPETSEFDKTKIIAFHVAYPTRVSVEADEDWILNVESHYANYIEYSKHYIIPFQYRGYNEIDTWKIGDMVSGSHQIQKTNVPLPLVVHTPNLSTDCGWEGQDEYSPLYSLFKELDNRLSDISHILSSHASPILSLPSGSLDLDENGVPYFNSNNKVLETMAGESEPKYITWQGNLQESMQFVREITEKILAIAELPAVALGGEAGGGTSGTSGTSILYRLNSIIAKTNRKKQYYEKSLSQIFLIAQLLEHSILGNKAGYEITKPHFTFKNGIPRDLNEESARIINLVASGLMSKKTAISLLYELNEEGAESELTRIEEEMEKENTFADASIFRQSQSDENGDITKEEEEKEKELVT